MQGNLTRSIRVARLICLFCYGGRHRGNGLGWLAVIAWASWER